MPMFDFHCEACGRQFEELVFDDEVPTCPACGSNETTRLVSKPSPLKTGAFPYKIGPVDQNFVNRVHQAEARAASGQAPSCGGGCGSCPHAVAPQSND